MFSLQSSLAQSPVPSLQSSCDKFLEWTEPLLTAQDFQQTKRHVAAFLDADGSGPALQNALIAQANSASPINWDCATWLDIYLSARYPLVINSNVFYYLKSKLNTDSFTQTQIASALIMSVYAFNLAIENETLSVDTQKGQPLCMDQYRKLFSATRIPQQGTDKLAITSGKKHIVVMYKAHMFTLNIADDNGNVLPFSEIEAALQQIMTETTPGQNIGLFTTLPRDEWAASRVILQTIDANNREQLTIIEEALFSLSLDENSPEQLIDCSTMLWHGDGKNRYFDKALQFIVFNNGKTGVNFEHAGMDGAVMLRLIGHIHDTIDSFAEASSVNAITRAIPLTFRLNPALTATLEYAGDVFKNAVAGSQTRILHFNEFGKNSVKKFKLSPDAFVQIALQLAEYKLHGKCSSAYEAIMTRGFDQGRIDVLFTVSMESKAFITAINNGAIDVQTKADLLTQAAAKHISRANECRQGMGIYTHLLALFNCYEKHKQQLGLTEIPALFTDKGYQILTHNMICTSTTSEYGVELAGYGPVVEDGYGIRYFNRADSIDFNITSRTDNQANLELLVPYIEQSLQEMAAVMRAV